MKDSIKKIVFCGTSISKREVETISSDWEIHPPIIRSNLPSIAVGKPGLVLIIDGYFFNQEAVSLMEIRNALNRGWTVVGTSSMGALRAVECAPLGMIGSGIIYRWVKRFQVEDDDEVAQAVHTDDGTPLSMAMVDIRYCVSRLRRKNLLLGSQGKVIIDCLKSKFFPDRTVELFKSLLPSHCQQSPEIEISIKNIDARNALIFCDKIIYQESVR